MVRRLLAALLLAALLASPGLAGPDAVELVDKAQAAMKDHEYGTAETLFRQAVGKMETCLPALEGLGESLLAQEKEHEAIVAFRKTVRVAESGEAFPTAWNDDVKRASRHLQELDDNGHELDGILDDHVEALVKLAAKYRRKDPDLADRALDLALTLRPDHERANELRRKMTDQGLRREALFDGKQIDDWDGGRSDWWQVKDGIIVAETKGLASYIRTQKEVSGNFDVVMEARITKTYDESPFIAIMGAWKGEYVHSRFGALGKALYWYEKNGKDHSDVVYRCDFASLPKPIDPAKWNTYELRFRKDTITAVVGGRDVHSIDRPKARDGGFVGILAQGCQAQIRKVEVVYR